MEERLLIESTKVNTECAAQFPFAFFLCSKNLCISMFCISIIEKSKTCVLQKSDFYAAALEASSSVPASGHGGAALLAEKHASEQKELAGLRQEAAEAAERSASATAALVEAEVPFSNLELSPKKAVLENLAFQRVRGIP